MEFKLVSFGFQLLAVYFQIFSVGFADMEFVKKFTPPDFQAKILHRQFYLISTQKMSENGEIYTAGNNFTLPPAVTALTNSTSAAFIYRNDGSKKKGQFSNFL